MVKGIYTVDDYLYETAVTRYVENNRCVISWKPMYNMRVNNTLYRRVSGLDIVPGDYVEIYRKYENPIRLKIEKPNKITIKRENSTITLEIK